MIRIDYKDQRSIYEQIVAGIKELIISKVLRENEQIPSVRELSITLTVNPNTVQKAYKELENTGFIYSIKGKGNFVSPASDIEDDNKKQELFNNLSSIIRELEFLNVKKSEIDLIIKNIYSEEEPEW